MSYSSGDFNAGTLGISLSPENSFLRESRSRALNGGMSPGKKLNHGQSSGKTPPPVLSNTRKTASLTNFERERRRELKLGVSRNIAPRNFPYP
jgi:hypothetical protein